MLHSPAIKNSGQFNRRIKVYRISEEGSDYGYVDETPVLLLDDWAMMEPKFRMMQENIMAGKETSLQEYHWLIRFRPSLKLDEIQDESSVNKKTYVEYNARKYDIIAIMPDELDTVRIVTELKE